MFKFIVLSLGFVFLATFPSAAQTECWGSACPNPATQDSDSLSSEGAMFYESTIFDNEGLGEWSGDGGRSSDDDFYRIWCVDACQLKLKRHIIQCENNFSTANRPDLNAADRVMIVSRCRSAAAYTYQTCVRRWQQGPLQ